MGSDVRSGGSSYDRGRLRRTTDGRRGTAPGARGRTAYRIALAADATPAERTAARELAEYLHKVTGATLRIGPPPAAVTGALIAVGPGAAKVVAPDLDLNMQALGEDGIVLKTVGEHLVLTGPAASLVAASSPTLTQSSPVENVLAMFEAIRELGQYRLRLGQHGSRLLPGTEDVR